MADHGHKIPTRDRELAAKIKANKERIKKGFIPRGDSGPFKAAMAKRRRRNTTSIFVGAGIKDPAKAAGAELSNVSRRNLKFGFKDPIKKGDSKLKRMKGAAARAINKTSKKKSGKIY